MTTPMERKKRICRAHPIHFVLVADDSKSMFHEPAIRATEGIQSWLTELQSFTGGVKSYFRFSFVRFGTTANLVVADVELNHIDPEAIVIRGDRGRTYLGRALAAARMALENDSSTADFCAPIVFVYTDGKADDREDALREANAIRALAKPCGRPSIVTLGFGDTDDAFLKQIADSPEYYKKLRNAKELAALLPAIGTPTRIGGGQSESDFHEQIKNAKSANEEDEEESDAYDGDM